MTNYGDTTAHPITRLSAKMERAKRDVARLDAWTRDPKNAGSDDWDYEYRELRRARARVERCRVAILRLDVALGHDANGYAAAALAQSKAKRTYYTPTPALIAFRAQVARKFWGLPA